MTTHPCPVPGCTETVEYQAPYEADRGTNVAAWRGGYLCPVCGPVRPHEVIADDPETLRELTG